MIKEVRKLSVNAQMTVRFRTPLAVIKKSQYFLPLYKQNCRYEVGEFYCFGNTDLAFNDGV